MRECPFEIRGVFFDPHGTLLVYGDMASGWAAWLAALRNWLRGQGQEMVSPHPAQISTTPTGRWTGRIRSPF